MRLEEMPVERRASWSGKEKGMIKDKGSPSRLLAVKRSTAANRYALSCAHKKSGGMVNVGQVPPRNRGWANPTSYEVCVTRSEG